MQGRSGSAQPRTSRIATMSARQRRSELAAIIASGIAKAIAARSERAQARRARMIETDPILKPIA